MKELKEKYPQSQFLCVTDASMSRSCRRHTVGGLPDHTKEAVREVFLLAPRECLLYRYILDPAFVSSLQKLNANKYWHAEIQTCQQLKLIFDLFPDCAWGFISPDTCLIIIESSCG